MRKSLLFGLLFICLGLCSFDFYQENKVIEDGKELYLTYCKSCHGKKGGLGLLGAAKLTKSKMDLDQRIEIITNGKGTMTPFGTILSKKEIKKIAEFTMTFSND